MARNQATTATTRRRKKSHRAVLAIIPTKVVARRPSCPRRKPSRGSTVRIREWSVSANGTPLSTVKQVSTHFKPSMGFSRSRMPQSSSLKSCTRSLWWVLYLISDGHLNFQSRMKFFFFNFSGRMQIWISFVLTIFQFCVSEFVCFNYSVSITCAQLKFRGVYLYSSLHICVANGKKNRIVNLWRFVREQTFIFIFYRWWLDELCAFILLIRVLDFLFDNL